MMKVDIDILNRYVSEGWVEKNDHPTFPISIYYYSRQTQFESKWDEITKQCRGLILDHEGNVIAKAFDKFFNMEEHKPEEIPNENFEVFEKMDGSLGIVFYYNGEWHLATKGSFNSDQAVKGRELLNNYPIDLLSPGYTYLFEIIYPENRIVVDYGTDEKLVMLACIDCSMDGIESDIHVPYYMDHFDVVKKYDGVNDYTELKSMISDNREGFVIRFGNGFRMKIKGEEYVRLHRILTNFSNIDIWEILKDDGDLSVLLERVPDEFDLWVKSTIEGLKEQYSNIENEYKWIFKVIMRSPLSATRKGFAEYALKYTHPSILFKMFDDKSYSDYIWKQIRPIYSKPFWQRGFDNE